MKARKTMKNQALIQEVITQLSPKFAPKIPDIKKVGKFICLSFSLITVFYSGHRHTNGKRVHRACAKYARYIRLHGLALPHYLLLYDTTRQSHGRDRCIVGA